MRERRREKPRPTALWCKWGAAVSTIGTGRRQARDDLESPRLRARPQAIGREASSKGNACQSPNFVRRDIHHELLKVVMRATLADPKSPKVICFLRLILWKDRWSQLECFATSVRFEGVLATRLIIRIATPGLHPGGEADRLYRRRPDSGFRQ